MHNSALLVELVVLERSEQVAIGIHIRSLSIGEGDSGLKMVGFVLRLAWIIYRFINQFVTKAQCLKLHLICLGSVGYTTNFNEFSKLVDH